MMTRLSNHDESHDDCKGVCIPKWAFKVGMGFLYVLALCFILTVAMVISLMVMISTTANQIRNTQVKNADRFERAVREAEARPIPAPE